MLSHTPNDKRRSFQPCLMHECTQSLVIRFRVDPCRPSTLVSLMVIYDQLTDRDTVPLTKFAILTLIFNRRGYHWEALGELVAPSTLSTRSERPCGARTDFPLLLHFLCSRPDLPKSALLSYMSSHTDAANTHAISVDTDPTPHMGHSIRVNNDCIQPI